MLRFPNPGSDIPTFIRIFRILYSYLYSLDTFTLDDMSLVLTKMNLASSSGFMGEQALRLSTRADRSRDPLYNQSKMYAELFRILGWVQSQEHKALAFKFTYLGAHMANANVNPKPLFLESLLGINYPNQIIDNKSEIHLRPFAVILRAMNDLDGVISRDELIIGPLSLDDVNGNYEEMVTRLRDLRKRGTTEDELKELSDRLQIQVNTMRNYTRFPLAALKFSGWTAPIRIRVGGKSMNFLSLTDEGRRKAQWIRDNVALSLKSIQNEVSTDDLPKIIRVAFFDMLERSGFDVDSIKADLKEDYARVRDMFHGKEIIFSPFQTLDNSSLSTAFADFVRPGASSTTQSNIALNVDNTPLLGPLPKSTVTFKTGSSMISMDKFEIGRKIVRAIRDSDGDIDEAVSALVEEYSDANKSDFYPLVADLFGLMGFNCINPRYGVNYERWDAIIIDSTKSIPIEIKSPSEEEYISVKAIRQALENKVVLLSREIYKTDRDTTTLAVGFKSPNDRSDVARLISDIYRAFGIRIAVFDFPCLLKIAALRIVNGKEIDREQFTTLVGIVNVEDI
jgi:hypothetical protein